MASHWSCKKSIGSAIKPSNPRYNPVKSTAPRKGDIMAFPLAAECGCIQCQSDSIVVPSSDSTLSALPPLHPFLGVPQSVTTNLRNMAVKLLKKPGKFGVSQENSDKPHKRYKTAKT